MKVSLFLDLLKDTSRTNYYVECSDDLGLGDLITRSFKGKIAPEDVHRYSASEITMEKAHQIEKDSRLAPSRSPINQFYIYKLQELSAASAAPLLKAVEEAKYSRFLFQAQVNPRKIMTLRSRSTVIKLPFLTKSVVLANIKAKQLDAKAVDELNLYDGTLAGSIRNLNMKDATVEIKREYSKGARGLVALFNESIQSSNAFSHTIGKMMSKSELAFCASASAGNLDRQRLATFLAVQRLQDDG